MLIRQQLMALLNECDHAPLMLVLWDMQRVERQPLVVLCQDMQMVSVIRIDMDLYVVPLVFGAVHGSAMYELQCTIQTHARNNSPDTCSIDLYHSPS